MNANENAKGVDIRKQYQPLLLAISIRQATPPFWKGQEQREPTKRWKMLPRQSDQININ